MTRYRILIRKAGRNVAVVEEGNRLLNFVSSCFPNIDQAILSEEFSLNVLS